MPSTSQKLFFLILLLLQTSNASSSKLLNLSKDLLQFFGDFLEPDSAQKMRETSRQWSSVNIYENIFPNESEVAMFRNVNTEEIISVGETMPYQEELVSHLRQNYSAKWNDVFLWFAENWNELMKNKSTNKVFLKALTLAIAENTAVKFTDQEGWSPLMLATAFGDTDSILALIKRDTNVNQKDNDGWTALHFASFHGHIDVCAILLDNDANIDAADDFRLTPLMLSAIYGKKNMYGFLIKKGADQSRINKDGNIASQLVNFRQR